jgi:O-antigen/teichoic acid export membrane protein
VALASGVAALAVIFGGRWLTVRFWHRPDAYWMLVVFAVNAPLVGVMGILLAGCRAVLDMKGDVLVRGFVAPLLLIGFAALYRLFTGGVYGMVLALTTSNVVGVGAAVWYFRKHYSLRKLLAGRHAPAPPGLLSFAIPQSINMTIWTGLWNVDLMMLGAYVADERIALYRIAAEIGRTVYGIRYSFSNVYAPLVARYTLEQNTAGLQDSYTRLSRWVSILAVPVVAIIVLCQAQLLWIVNPSFDGGAAFLWLLLVGPLLACATGLSGNILVMTGHHFWNLSNSALLLGTLTLLNLALIPRHGMLGASIATMTAISGMSLLQIVEVRWLNGVRVEVARLWKPFAAGTLGFLVAYGAGEAIAGAPRLALALTKLVVLVVVYVATLRALGLDAEDAELLASWRARTTAR